MICYLQTASGSGHQYCTDLRACFSHRFTSSIHCLQVPVHTVAVSCSSLSVRPSCGSSTSELYWYIAGEWPWTCSETERATYPVCSFSPCSFLSSVYSWAAWERTRLVCRTGLAFCTRVLKSRHLSRHLMPSDCVSDVCKTSEYISCILYTCTCIY